MNNEIKRRRTTNNLLRNAVDGNKRKFQKEDKDTKSKRKGKRKIESPEERSQPQRRKLDKKNYTAFDEMRANQFPGLYMPKEYVETIVSAMNEDSLDKVEVNYFEKVQTDIKPRMRTILCGWLTEVLIKFGMNEIVLWQTFQIIDRYLRTTDLKRNKFQLLGCAAMWIASKYHEIYPPLSGDLVHMSDGAFEKEHLIRMEEDVCDKLGYEIKKTPFDFLERYTDIAIHSLSSAAHKELDAHMKADPASTDITSLVKKVKRVKFLARYALERYNLNPASVGRPPRALAAMAVYTALALTSNQWTTKLEEATGYSLDDLRSDNFIGGTFQQFKSVVLDFENDAHKAVIRKYRCPERGGVSTLRKRGSKKPTTE